MSRVKIVHDEDIFIFPRADVRRIATNYKDSRVILMVNLAGEDEPYTVAMRYCDGEDVKKSFDAIRKIAVQIRDDLDPFNVDINITWSCTDWYTWVREENK